MPRPIAHDYVRKGYLMRRRHGMCECCASDDGTSVVWVWWCTKWVCPRCAHVYEAFWRIRSFTATLIEEFADPGHGRS